jgi:hypothetical protein
LPFVLRYILREVPGVDMKMKFGVQQALASAGIFALILLTLVSVDDRVRARVSELASGGEALGSWTDRAAFLGDAVWDAARHQSIENAPLVIFATVGAVLFLFMVRT